MHLFSMKFRVILYLFASSITLSYSQTKIAGKVLDENGNPLPYVNIVFTGSIKGTITDEKGEFYLQSDKTYESITLGYLGYKKKEVPLKPNDKYLIIKMEPDAETLQEVNLVVGKPKNKGNPAVEILKKIWKKKKHLGLNAYDYYAYEKYEKIEFDIYNVDSSLVKSKLMRGLEFVFDYVDTSRITGKPFLPIFINESYYRVYGKNKPPKKIREDLLANKASGVKNNEFVNLYLKDLYVNYNIYDNFISLFGKDFVSPLSKFGPTTYYYVLADTMEIDGKKSYNIIFYPRRKRDLAFKGDMWVADSVFSVQQISMYISRSANINWVKDFYLEQSFDLVNDSVALLKRDHVMTELGLEQMENAPDMLVKKTTFYSGYELNNPMPDKFYNEEKFVYDKEIYSHPEEFWKKLRPEKLNSNEQGIYEMLDSLQKTPKFKRMQDLATILGSGYAYVKYFDYGPVFSTVGYNDVEGIRLRLGGRTYFETNDLWRIEAYGAWGFKDRRFKYGVSGKVLLDVKNRILLSAGYRQDVEQIGVSLTLIEDDILSRSFASSSVFATGDRTKLTFVKIFDFSASVEPVKNLEIKAGFSHKILGSAHPRFSLDFIGEDGFIHPIVKQPETYFQVKATPKRKTAGYGVKRYDINSDYSIILLRFSKGFSFSSSETFDYTKVQFFYNKRWYIGAVGKLDSKVETGKTFGKVPLALLNVVPGNQSFFYVDNSFQLLNYYEFITDTYFSVRLKHNFEGRIFSKIPILNKTKWRELVFFNWVWGSVSDENKSINASGITYVAPDQPYFEYGVGVTNILKFLEFDALWRGNYFNPNAQNFFIKMKFEVDF